MGQIIRDGASMSMTLTLSFMEWLVTMDPSQPPEYFIIGGLVFTVLSEPFLSHRFGTDYETYAPARLLLPWSTYARREFVDHQIVVLTQVLADDLTQGLTSLQNVVLEAVNNQKVKNLRHVIDTVEASEEEW